MLCNRCDKATVLDHSPDEIDAALSGDNGMLLSHEFAEEKNGFIDLSNGLCARACKCSNLLKHRPCLGESSLNTT